MVCGLGFWVVLQVICLVLGFCGFCVWVCWIWFMVDLGFYG